MKRVQAFALDIQNRGKALVYQGPGRKALEDRPIPEITVPNDAIVRIAKTTNCGTDLHILKGDVPNSTPGRILGHEETGTVEKVGAGVTMFHPGDRALVSCISACGRCEYCRRGMYSHCTTGGGSWATRSTAPRRSMCVSRIPIRASILFRWE